MGKIFINKWEQCSTCFSINLWLSWHPSAHYFTLMGEEVALGPPLKLFWQASVFFICINTLHYKIHFYGGILKRHAKSVPEEDKYLALYRSVHKNHTD